MAALVAITSADADPARGDAAVAGLADVIRDATGATVAVVWTHDPREAAGRLVAAAGVPDDVAIGVAEAIEGDGVEDEVEITPGAAGALSARARRAGAPWGIAVPVARLSGAW